MARKRMTTVFRDLMEKEKLIVAPGAYDPLSAKIIASLGFKAIYVTGSGSTSGFLAMLDLGFLTLTEMTNHGHRIAVAANIPVINDADVGFGTAIHITRTIEEFIYAGVAGVHIEDQLTTLYGSARPIIKPELMSMEAFAGKIKSAAAARDEIDPDFVIIARSDSGSVLGYDEVVKRCNAYLKAGADMAMPVGHIRGSREECINSIRRTVKDIKGPVFGLGFDAHGLTVKDVEEMGYKLYTFPVVTVQAAARAIRDVVQEIKEKGTPKGYFDKFPPIPSEEFNRMEGIEKYLEIQKKYMTVPRDY